MSSDDTTSKIRGKSSIPSTPKPRQVSPENVSGLPRLLLPNDPENLLSLQARKRINRALIEADRFIWEALRKIKRCDIDTFSPKAYQLLSDAHFEKAKEVLLAKRKEFSQLNLPDRRYREIMNEEIESASYSLELSDVERRYLETICFLPEENPFPAQSGGTTIRLTKQKTRGRGREESPIKRERWKILRVIHARDPKLRGEAFWTAAYNEGARAELTWRQNGCPADLGRAYKIAHWQRRLNDDKSRCLSNSHSCDSQE